jgi:hypothetical protein
VPYSPTTRKPKVKPSDIVVPEGSTLTGSGGSSGTPVISITSAANVGVGSGIFYTLIDGQLQFKSLVAGTGITISSSASEITITNSISAGEVNTASNVGSGEGVYKQKTGTDLEFKSLVSGKGLTVESLTNTIQIRVKDLTALPLFDTSSSAVGALIFSNPPTQTELENFRDAVKTQLDNLISDLGKIRTYVTQLES